MIEEIDFNLIFNTVFNFLYEYNLFPIIICFIIIHFSLRFIHFFIRSLTFEDISKKDFKPQIESEKIVKNIELPKDVVLSNENFIKF